VKGARIGLNHASPFLSAPKVIEKRKKEEGLSPLLNARKIDFY
jgi:hypothetical protein